MTSAAWLIAGREFRAYVATASFWIALAVGPLIMGVGMMALAHKPAPPAASQTLTLSRAPDGVVEARFTDGFPMAAQARTQLLDILRRDTRIRGQIRLAPQPAAKPLDAGAISRFVLVMMLWMTLAGSLGMLLQATVRERANKALESLLAAASPAEIVGGKLIGIGGVSALVVGAWLGSTLAFGALLGGSGGMVSGLLRGMDQPVLLLRALGIYLATFAFYGLTTVAIGARARDSADAQNLARPMFAILLAVFFAALLSIGAASPPAWLTYAPPFTPFMLLLHPQPAPTELAALALLALSTVIAGRLAIRAVTLDPSPGRIPKRRSA